MKQSEVKIGVFLSQEMSPITYFKEKPSESQRKWLTYEQKNYAQVSILKH